MAEKKASGVRGDWFAKVDGERLPCVHKFWWEKGTYNDTKLKSSPKADELFEAIKELKRVILTDDTPEFEGSEVVRFERKARLRFTPSMMSSSMPTACASSSRRDCTISSEE